MFPHPFLTTETEFEEYTEAMEAFADAADQLPEPPAEIWLDDDDGGDDDRYYREADSYLDASWEDRFDIGDY